VEKSFGDKTSENNPNHRMQQMRQPTSSPRQPKNKNLPLLQQTPKRTKNQTRRLSKKRLPSLRTTKNNETTKRLQPQKQITPSTQIPQQLTSPT
jgi:hypothetical protein